MLNFGGVCTSLRKIEIWNETGAPSYHPTSRHDGSNACWMSTGASHNCPPEGEGMSDMSQSDTNQMNLKSKKMIIICIYIYSSHPPLKPQIKLFRLNPTKGIKISQTTNVGHRWSQELLQLPMWAGTYSTCGDSMHLFKLVYCIKNDGFFIESSSL